jgi:O-antigen ligase
MIAGSFEHRIKLQKLFFAAAIAIFAVWIGYALVSGPIKVFLLISGMIWLLTLPYHSQISICLSVATFMSALILPFFPGRPYFWEFAALLGWSGLFITLSVRRYRPDAARIFRENRWLFVGLIGYCLVLLVTMYFRGFGLRILGSDVMGGRFYFQQLVCAVFPFLFVLCWNSEKTLLRLFILQCCLTVTFLISDFVFARAPKEFFFILQFFELPGDAVGFEMNAQQSGMQRFQSLAVGAQGLLFLLFLRLNLNQVFGRKGILLIPLSLLILGFGLISGHRILALVVGVTFFFYAFAHRFFSMRNLAVFAGMASFVLVIVYAFADRLPLAAQRALSFLPAIQISDTAYYDGYGTLETRRQLREIGMQMAPDYFWLGRGFGQMGSGDFSQQWDPTGITMHVNQGRFYNGIIGLLVNTGFAGTVFMVLFLGCGTALAWRILRHLRTHGCEDAFERMCGILCGFWMASTLSFIFLHGDSEYAMKSFSLQAGMLLACYYLLERRLKDSEEQATTYSP